MGLTESPELARRKRGLERFLLFSDGVSAIAVTLLVLPLVDEVTSSDGAGVTAWDILTSLRWEMFSFALSFFVIVLLWLAHQRVFENVISYDMPVLRAGVLWLFGIVTLSFSTALVADHGSERIVILLYICNLVLPVGALTFVTNHLHRHPDLLHPGTAVDSHSVRKSWIGLGLLGLALTLVLIFPGLGFFVMFVLFLDGPIGRRLQAQQSTRANPSHSKTPGR